MTSATALGAPPAESTTTLDAAQRQLLLDQVDSVLATVERVRGLSAPNPVAREILARDLVRAHVLEILDREMPSGVRDALDRSARALGLAPEGTTWFDGYLDLVQSEVAGFYDEHNETLYLLDDTPMALQTPVLSHELFHAVQDQNWGIGKLVGDAEWLSDTAMAAQALIEGDALAVMTAFSLGSADELLRESVMRATIIHSLREADDANTTDAPSSMWTQLVFPYTAGFEFVLALASPDGWSLVDAAYADPPISTEQVLHPERYLNRDQPTWLEFDVDRPTGAGRYMTDVLGERMTSAMCIQLLVDAEQPVSLAACEGAAAGWDGDRLELYAFDDEPDRDLVVWATVWDTVDDARTFATVAARLGDPWLGASADSSGEGAHGQAWLAESGTGRLQVERWGDLVLLVLDRGGATDAAVRRDAIDRVADSVWTSIRRSQYPELRSSESRSEAD